MPDGVREEMACRTSQLGGIITTSREALDKGKVNKLGIPGVIKSL